MTAHSGPGAPTCTCSRPIRDHAYLCRDCTTTLERLLGDLPALVADLDVTRTRQSRLGSAGTGIVARSAERPVPWDDRAAKVAGRVRVALVGWVRAVGDGQVLPEGPACGVEGTTSLTRCDCNLHRVAPAVACVHPSCRLIAARRPPEDTVEGMSRWLLTTIPATRHRPEVTALADDLHRLTKEITAVVDRPPEQVFYGPCGSVEYLDDQTPDPVSVPCPADLYGPDKATDLTCEACRAEHKVSDVRAYLLARAESQLVTAVDLSRFLTAYGEPLTAERIRQWATRGQLVPHGTDGDRPLYRVSEVIDLLAAMTMRRGKQGAA